MHRQFPISNAKNRQKLHRNTTIIYLKLAFLRVKEQTTLNWCASNYGVSTLFIGFTVSVMRLFRSDGIRSQDFPQTFHPLIADHIIYRC